MRSKVPFVFGLLLVATVAHSQVARVSEHSTGMLLIDASPGDTLEIDLSVDLGRHSASGITLYVQVPTEGFHVVGTDLAAGPFVPGDLFSGAMVVRNEAVPDEFNMSSNYRLLEFTTLLGPENSRGRTGSGSIACFRLVCERPSVGSIRLHHSPIHESRIVLDDGRSEVPLFIAPPVQIDVDLDTSVQGLSWGQIKRPFVATINAQQQ